MSEKQFKLSSETVLQYQIMDNDTDLNENEVVDKLNELSEENEQLRKELDNFKPVMFQDVRKGTVTLYSKD